LIGLNILQFNFEVNPLYTYKNSNFASLPQQLGPISVKAQRLPRIDGIEYFFDSPWLVGISGWNIGALEGGTSEKMLEHLAVVIICVLLWIMICPLADVALESLAIRTNSVEIGVILSLMVNESIELEANDSLESKDDGCQLNLHL
jgi:hypothetical protein